MSLPPIEALIPHRGAMCLVDRLLEASPTHAVAEVTVPDDSLFHDHDVVPAWVGLEYMAQAIAAWSGAQRVDEGGPPRVGLLLGTRRYDAHVPAFAPGWRLRIEVRPHFRADNGLGQFDGVILRDGQVLATARLSVFEPADGAALLSGAAA